MNSKYKVEHRRIGGINNKIFQLVIVVILSICAICAILPLIILVASSFTTEGSLMKNGYNFWPKEFSLNAYVYVFKSNGARIFTAYGVTVLVTLIGTFLSLFIGPMLAWPLSRKDYKRAKIFTFVVFFTMLFSGGIVPSYIMWTQLFEIKNTIWALIFPNLLTNGFFIILLKNNFSHNIHPSLIEAAKMDGAGELFIYFKIVLPLSVPILTTIGLIVCLGYWNDWTNGLYYVSDQKLYSLQQLLKSIIDNIKALSTMNISGGAEYQALPSVSIRMAMAVIGIVPIMLLYPLFQKAFVSGISLGGVKE